MRKIIELYKYSLIIILIIKQFSVIKMVYLKKAYTLAKVIYKLLFWPNSESSTAFIQNSAVNNIILI